MIAKLIAGLLGQIIGIFGDRGKAAQAALDARIGAMQRSLTDEVIVCVWFSPLVVGWFSPERSDQWIASVFSNQEYTALLMSITAAVFGLGKINGRK